ncbi:PPC domain-containing DNA-binding protein [Paucidesulfovibrio longus]|uniref:PPC domain-containing DNA-binding protein n=1 Tax=Paucidesulfovibrio longus TaxID=889 RepID=UPI0003B4AAB5|nr:PPC domain-containing DNA-binding protein [Paucidesulfovibrio longus]
MKYAEGRTGRVFVLRLESGDRMPDTVEKFAQEHDIASAACWLLGGIGCGNLVVGPEDTAESGDQLPPVPMLHEIQGVHEAAAVGTLFPNAEGSPRLHMHTSLGRGGVARTGCIRPGIDVWGVAEVVILELLDLNMRRRIDPATGLEMLHIP